MRIGIGLWLGSAAGGGLGAIIGTPVSLAQPVDGDTMADVITWGSFTATRGTLLTPVRETRINGGAWAAYNGSTALVAFQTLEVRETVETSLGLIRIDTDGPETVVGEDPATYPVVRSRNAVAVTPSNALTHALTNPAGATSGDLVVFAFGFDNGGSTTVSITGGTDWNLSVQAASGGAFSIAIVWKVLNGTGDSVTLTTSTSEQASYLGWAISEFTGTPIISAFNAQTGTVAPDCPSVSFGGTKLCRVLAIGVQSQNDTIQSGAPSGYGNFQTINSNTTGTSSVRTFAAELEVTGTSENPGAFPVSVSVPVTVTIAIEG